MMLRNNYDETIVIYKSPINRAFEFWDHLVKHLCSKRTVPILSPNLAPISSLDGYIGSDHGQTLADRTNPGPSY